MKIIIFSLGAFFGIIIATFVAEHVQNLFSWDYGFASGVLTVAFFELLFYLYKKNHSFLGE